jgi:autotransporter translocation and assembly factor TamB
LEQADIVSLLVFGRTTDKLTGSEESSLGNKAQNAALSAVAGQAASIVGEELGLDSVEVEVGDDPSESRVGTGKYITQDIFLSYERQLGKDGGNTVGVEYSINRNLKLKGSSSDTGESAVDLIWRKDY